MICSKCNQEILTGWHKFDAGDSSDVPHPKLGSNGAGVRAKVFEIIVRQGMVGAPWREICEGPMQVNNISPEKVQAEIDRRRGMIAQELAKKKADSDG